MNEITTNSFGTKKRINHCYYSSRLRSDSRNTRERIKPQWGDEAFMVRKIVGNRVITYYVEHQRVRFGIDSWNVYMSIGKKCIKFIDKLLLLHLFYTKESVAHALRKSPTFKNMVLEQFDKSEGVIRPFENDTNDYIVFWSGDKLSSRWDKFEQEIFDKMLKVADGVVYESKKFVFNVNDLKKRTASHADWVSKTLQIGAVIVAKTAVKAIATNIDIPIDFTDGDCSGDIDFGDVDLSGCIIMDSDDYSAFTSIDFDNDGNSESGLNSSNISFHGKNKLPPNANSDGYIPHGSITLEKSIGLGTDTYKLYNKDGSDYILNDGVYKKISGKSRIKIGETWYKC